MLGTLYGPDGEQYVSSIEYKVYGDSQTYLRGELRPREYSRIDNGGVYVIELEDKRRCQCYLRKRANVAGGVRPGSSVYSFKGIVSS